MSTEVYNGYLQSVIKVYSPKYNVLIATYTLEYPDEDGIVETKQIIGRIRTLITGEKIPKYRGAYITWDISYKSFTTKTNYKYIVEILNYILNDNKKLVLYPHSDGKQNFRVTLHPDSYEIAEKIVYSRTIPQGYEGISLKFITLDMVNQFNLYDPDLLPKFSIAGPNYISIT